MSAETARRIVQLRREIVATEARAKQLKAELEELSPKLLDWFAETGMDRGSWDGMTLYQRRELWASIAAGIDMRKVKAALKAAGVDPKDIIKEKANTQTLSSLVRELEASEAGIPKKLAACLSLSELFKLGFREGNGSERAAA